MTHNWTQGSDCKLQQWHEAELPYFFSKEVHVTCLQNQKKLSWHTSLAENCIWLAMSHSMDMTLADRKTLTLETLALMSRELFSISRV